MIWKMERLTELEKKKIEIADQCIKVRNSLLGIDHPYHRNESLKIYEAENEKLYDLMSELEDLEDEERQKTLKS
jgi:hypothetical protein